MAIVKTIAGMLLFLGGGIAHAVQDCEMNGEHVNPANGATTAGKSGIMRCIDRDSGKLVREEEYRNGRAVGYRKSTDFQGNVSVGNYNENGNRDGEFKQFDAEGNLLAEERYVNGDSAGLQTSYHRNRQVRRRAYAEPRKGTLASIEYNDRGQVMRLQCAEKPLLGDDRALCGFDKPSEVPLHNARGDVIATARYENGKRTALTELGSSGTPVRTQEVQGARTVTREHYSDGPLRIETVSVGNRRESERELARSGQTVRETHWQDGFKGDETLWYLNGQMRSRTRWERNGRDVLVKADEFWDNGKLRARTVRDERRGYVGVQQRYTEAGVLESEQTYDAGKLTRRRDFKDGAVVLDEEFHEDGSRKSTRRSD